MSADLATAPQRHGLADGRARLFGGDPDGAAQAFRAIARAEPANYEARYWLYSALVAANDWDAATPALEEARLLHSVAALRALDVDMARFQTDKTYCAEIGLRAYGMKLMGPASLALGRSLDFDKLDPQIMVSYGLSLQHQGRLHEAVEVLGAAAGIFANPIIHEFLLTPVFIAGFGPERMAEESRKWGDLYAPPLAPHTVTFTNARDTDRPLRIGYIGPTFTRNQVTQFLLPVIEAHDPEAVDVHLYCADPDAEGQLPATCKLRKIGDLPSERIAAMVRDDKIDILIDIWGHTAGSCLPVFSLRPAPVQVAWINFLQSTGLACMDYVFHCDGMAVPGTEALFTEEIWSLGELMSPSRPAANRPDPAPTPALKNGYVTFGSFNNPAKLNEITVAAWAQILRGRPDAKLVLKYSYFSDPVLQRVTQARFAAYGANPEQLEFRGESKGLDYLLQFRDIDLALDPSPAIGGATTHDALGNGVPVLSNRGDNYYARSGACTVLPLGIPELVADDWDQYVERALDLTADFEALDRLRSRIRPAFETSSYRDEAGFTRIVEDAFRQMFARWTAST
ncbi:tetratricopeptide repeat protein [Caulobacter soli]|uniref:O-linked N-acetylglucosamine transferase, SPINDLY family protein n=1 Tax=Caulobacter soli TaxID=2708539 RepID=UPI0013ED9195|nr:tetratricopeptide repeat protein [Caulobacter soli]